MDYESEHARTIGSWDPEPVLAPFYERWSNPDADFVPDKAWRDMVATLGFGSVSTPENLAFWDATLLEVYSGEQGRKRLRMALVNLLWRDGLLHRLRDIRCPVHWLHVSYSLPIAPPAYFVLAPTLIVT